MRILKFGGTSVATAARRQRVAEVVGRALDGAPAPGHSVTVVTSALAGVTDLLERALDDVPAGAPVQPRVAEIAARHLAELSPIPETAGLRRSLEVRLAELEVLLAEVAARGQSPPALRDRVLACGERLALPLVVSALRQAGLDAGGVDATRLLVAPRSCPETPPQLDLARSRRRTKAYFQAWPARRVAVVTGFLAGDGNGGTTTLGRGASDLSATFLARCLDASGVEIWSDVDGVLTAPPGLVPGARPLGELSYDDAAGLAQFGARVLHPDSLTPIVDSGIPVWVRNTLRPEVPGTRISGNPPDSARFGPPAVHAITAVTDASQLSATVHWGTHDLMSRTFAILERHGIHPLVLERRSTGRRLDLLVRRSEADRLERAFGKVPEAEGIRWDRHDGLTVVAAAGRGGPWIAGELARVLHVEGIAPSTISGMAGAPGICAVAVVPASQGGRAVRALHAAVVEHVEGGARPGCLAGRRSRFANPSGSLQEALAV